MLIGGKSPAGDGGLHHVGGGFFRVHFAGPRWEGSLPSQLTLALFYDALTRPQLFMVNEGPKTPRNPLHATIEEFTAEGFTHVECYCPRCRMIRLRPINWFPRISTIAQFSARLRCAECGRVHSVEVAR
jgi:hypothetical protein